MATATKDIIKCVASAVNAPPDAKEFPQGNSATPPLKGEIVFLNASGQLTEIANTTPSQILGVMAENMDVSDSTAKKKSVFLAAQHNIFEANLLGTGGADLVSAASDIGKHYGIYRDTTNNITYIDNAVVSGANARVFTLGFARGSTAGDTNARVLFVFDQATYQLGTTS